MNIVITDCNFSSHQPEREIFGQAGLDFEKLSYKNKEELIKAGKNAEIFLVQYEQIDRSVIDGWENCKLIVRYGIGVDNIDIKYAETKGIQVCNVPNYCLDEVADHTCALILSGARKIIPLHKIVKGGNWDFEETIKPMPPFSERTVGLVGFGNIGKRVARRLAAFQFTILVYDPFVESEEIEQDNIRLVNALESLLAESDIISLHLPLTSETHHLLDKNAFKAAKNSALLVNTSRGSLVDTRALSDAIRDGLIGGAALDVYEEEPVSIDHPLLDSDRVTLTPHVAYYSDSSLLNLQKQAAEEIVRWVRGEPVHSPVNQPKG